RGHRLRTATRNRGGTWRRHPSRRPFERSPRTPTRRIHKTREEPANPSGAVPSPWPGPKPRRHFLRLRTGFGPGRPGRRVDAPPSARYPMVPAMLEPAPTSEISARKPGLGAKIAGPLLAAATIFTVEVAGMV